MPELTREGVRESVRLLFIYCSDGLSDQTHGFRFMAERGEIRIYQRTWAKARDIVRLTPSSKIVEGAAQACATTLRGLPAQNFNSRPA